MPVSGPGNAFPATATGVPLSVFAFGFAVGILDLVDTGILSGRATGMFVAVAIGTGALGLLLSGLWDFRGRNLFAGTFGVAYALFLLTTGLILRFFATAVIAAAGANAFRDAFAARLILWAVFTAVMAIGAYTINLPAYLAFVLLAAVYVILASQTWGGTAGWVSPLTRIGGWSGTHLSISGAPGSGLRMAVTSTAAFRSCAQASHRLCTCFRPVHGVPRPPARKCPGPGA